MKKPLIGIIGGKGKMGKYFSQYWQSLGYKVLISDIGTSLSNIELAQQCDVVIVSVPIQKTIDVIKAIAPFVRKGSLLMDFTSIKVAPVKAMLKSKAEVIGCHPLFGPYSGLRNQIMALCPARSKKWLVWLKKSIQEGGGIIKTYTPEEHDNLMAIVQVLTHFSDITLAYALKLLKIPLKKFLDCQSPAYRLKLDMMGRILAQSPELYGQILLSNPKRVKVIQTYIKAQEKLLKIASKKDIKGFISYFQEGANYLGDFKSTALRESNYLVDHLNSRIPKAQKKTKPKKDDLLILGPKNTYSEVAARCYNENKNLYYCQSITEIFDYINEGKAKEALVPIDNKEVGAIIETIDNLYNSKLYIKKEILLPIHHCLCVIPGGNMRKIKFVLSKDVALQQCSRFLRDKLPNATLIPTMSTSEAMNKVVRENLTEAACIGSKDSAEKLKLKVLKENIGNNDDNATKFIVITKRKPKSYTQPDAKSSIAFHFPKDKPGSLFSILKEFANAKINLTKIETRPTRKSFGDYIFYIDFDGSISDSKIQKVLNKVEKKVAKLQIFGSFELLECK